MKRRCAIACLWPVALAAFAFATDPLLTPVADPSPMLRGLQEKMSTMETVYLEFTQERHLKIFTEPLKSEGVMFIAKPDLIRWETTDPFRSILLGDHRSVAQFENNDGAWKKLKLEFPQLLRRLMEQMVRMHQGKLDALGSDFVMSVATGAVTVVTMVPKDKNVLSMMSSIEVKMSPDFSATREVVLNEPGGDLTKIIFRNETRDLKLPPGTFDQSKPLEIAAVRAALGHAP